MRIAYHDRGRREIMVAMGLIICQSAIGDLIEPKLSWPFVRIVLRADSDFARETLMAWCEQHRVDYLFGLARNARLVAIIEEELAAARAAAEKTGRPARRFKDFQWSTRDTWSQERRVVAKAEWTEGEANPRFVVTSLKRSEAGARRAMAESG